ncbi:iron-sulfur cluster assembly scaffold protein [Candidatus Nesciobacter abundans]|uniref:Fe-S cluster assembly scaffold IscU n=1 Tax=Candidatus Nesciobacter abundans TaxID=2601668 RepID=A0A5C0UHL3_9PROT|nr:iron-sulfur cluster assembly scaffold protein [Candidatus Nesciobacter abundans]QEK39269.1 Fe-S cluster assembly scaffold IscU [Candidatus Nesciobacter abundans]
MHKYNTKINTEFQNPANTGSMDENDPAVGMGFVGSPSCGDVLKLFIRIENDPNKSLEDQVIVDSSFQIFGCGSAIASGSHLTKLVKGKTLSEAEKITNKSIASNLELPPIKTHCSVLAEGAIRGAIENIKEKKSNSK